jgi:hypothetical protein
LSLIKFIVRKNAPKNIPRKDINRSDIDDATKHNVKGEHFVMARSEASPSVFTSNSMGLRP